MTQTFTNSQEVLSYLQKRFGSADYSRWQMLRRPFYSWVQYLEAGASEYNFFADPKGSAGVTIEDTNIPKSNSFGQNHFLLKAIKFDIRINTWDMDTYAGTDVTTLYSDMLLGFVQAGVMELSINNRKWLEVPKPFMYMPPGNGQALRYNEGIAALTLTEGTPNTLSSARCAPPYATLNSRQRGQFLLDPHLLIEAEQTFSIKVSFPSGIIPVIGTTVTDDSSNKLYIGCILDGVVFRPVQ